MFRVLVAVLLATGVAAPSAVSAGEHELFVPIAGRGVAADGRTFSTALWITNGSPERSTDVRLAFFRSRQPNTSPREHVIRLAAGESRVVDPVGDEILQGGSIGAIRIRSSERVFVSAQTLSRLRDEPLSTVIGTAFSAVSGERAIRPGEAFLLHGVTLGNASPTRYRVYLVETRDRGVTFTLSVVDNGGRTVVQRGYFLGRQEQRILDLGEEFPGLTISQALVRIRVTNGDGRVIGAGAAIPEASRDAISYEMMSAPGNRSRIPLSEALVYVAVALALVAAAIKLRR